MNQRNAEALHEEIEEWLAAPDPSTNHNAASKLCHQGTGGWVTGSDVFRQWQQGKFALIWLHGISGCGKTVLSSRIVEHLRASEKVGKPLIYFYFDVQDTRKQTLDHLLRSLINQLFLAHQASWHGIESLYETCKGGSTQPTTSQLRECLKKMFEHQSITIVLDALDECSTRDELLTWIRDVCHLKVTQLVVTSRTEHDISAVITQLIPHDAMLEIKGTLLEEDIRTFVRFSIYQDLNGLQRWRSNPSIQQDIEQRLMEKSKGM